MSLDLPQQQHRRQRHKLLSSDPVRTSPHSRLDGCGPNRSYRHLHHQRGTVGTFHVRLLEGKGLRRRHWSALSLGPARHLGLSRAHGEVSSFGTFRLAFWRDGSCDDNGGGCGVEEAGEEWNADAGPKVVPVAKQSASSISSLSSSPSGATAMASSEFSATFSSAPAQTASSAQHAMFMPSMPVTPRQPSTALDSGKSPLTPLFDQGCIRTFSPARSPFLPTYGAQQQSDNPQRSMSSSSGYNDEWDGKPSSMPNPPTYMHNDLLKMPIAAPSSAASHGNFGPPPPHHYAKEQFKSSTVQDDSNPIWGDAGGFSDANHDNNGDENRSTFRIPLQKDDLLPALRSDGAKVSLEIRLDEEMAPTEQLLVGGALSTAVGAAAAATSVVPLVGSRARDASHAGMEMLGLGTDRLIGRGYVDLMPLLLGLWEESWDERREEDANPGGSDKEERAGEDDATLDECGRLDLTKHKIRRRVERMGMLDVWVPLYHPTANSNNKGNSIGDCNDNNLETSGKIHLLISYQPNGISPKRDDVVAFESFARRPLSNGGHVTSANDGPIVNPVVPPLSPLLVVETHKSGYLLLEHPVARTVTSVDRSGNVKSSRWERFHRVRVKRSAVFVVERRTLADAAGSLARLPGDVVLGTPLGREVAEATAPIVAGAMELMGPALLWGKLMMAAGGTGVRAGLAGARAATEAVVTASVEKALESRQGGGGGCYGEHGGGDNAGVYSSYGG